MSKWNNLFTVFKIFFNVYLFIFERDRVWVGEALLHRAWCGARTHKPWDHDLSWSWILNWLSHPGTPRPFLKKLWLLRPIFQLLQLSMRLSTFLCRWLSPSRPEWEGIVRTMLWWHSNSLWRPLWERESWPLHNDQHSLANHMLEPPGPYIHQLQASHQITAISWEF